MSKGARQAGCYLAVLLTAAMPSWAGGNQCPPPPNPNDLGCPLAINRSTLTEEDLDIDGLPDNAGSTGGFCGGDSPAECIPPPAVEVSFDLIIPNPATQDVTCTVPGEDIWIMSDGCNSCLATGFGSVTLPAGSTTDTTLKVVVVDMNSDVCFCGPTLTCTYSNEAACNDGSDGDGDGLIDGDDPDCCIDGDNDGFCGAADCDDSDPAVWSEPSQVRNLTLSIGAPTPMTWIDWLADSGAVVDLVSGQLSDLRADGDYLLAECLANDAAGTTYEDTRPDPRPDDGYYYLARAQNSCGTSTYGDSTLTPDPRDILDLSGPCP